MTRSRRSEDGKAIPRGKQQPERIVMESKLLASGAEPRNPLGGQPQTFKVELDEPARQSVKAALDRGRRIVLNFEDAGVEGTPDTTYEVYVNVPADQPPRGSVRSARISRGRSRCSGSSARVTKRIAAAPARQKSPSTSRKYSRPDNTRRTSRT